MNNLIKDIAECERPYEKAVTCGINTLTDAELLAVIMRSGTKTCSVIDISNQILNLHPLKKGLLGLNYLQREDLLKIKGVGNTKATQILSVIELSRRLSEIKHKKNLSFNNPVTISEYYMDKCKYLKTVHVYLMLFNSAHELIKDILISEGTVNLALISPRSIMIEALRYEATCFILVHNHPSGNCTPSEADIHSTKRIKAAADIMDITMSDHIIVGHDCYYSMLERGII